MIRDCFVAKAPRNDRKNATLYVNVLMKCSNRIIRTQQDHLNFYFRLHATLI